MGDLGKHAVFFRLKENDTPTSRTGTATFANDNTEWIPVNPDGAGLAGDMTITDLPTEHKDRGLKYQILDKRNTEAKTLTTRIWPENAGTLLHAGITVQSANELPKYHHGEQYWTGSIVSGTGTGAQLLGILFTGISLGADKDAGGAIEASLSGFVNQDIKLTAAAPTPVFSGSDPYSQIRTYVDIEFANSSGVFTAWTGNNTSIKSVTLDIQLALEVRSFNPSATAAKDLVWTKAILGDPTATAAVVYFFDNADVEDYGRGNYIQKARMRFMAKRTGANYSDVANEALTAGTSVTVTPTTGVSGLAVNDIVMIEDPDSGETIVAVVDTVNSTAGTFVIDVLDASLDGSGTNSDLIITNGAFEVKVHEMNLQGRPKRSPDGGITTLSLNLNGILKSGGTGEEADIATVHAYNDDNA